MKDYTIKAYTIVDETTVHIVPHIQEIRPVWLEILSKLRDTFLRSKIDRMSDASIEAKTRDLIDAEIIRGRLEIENGEWRYYEEAK